MRHTITTSLLIATLSLTLAATSAFAKGPQNFGSHSNSSGGGTTFKMAPVNRSTSMNYSSNLNKLSTTNFKQTTNFKKPIDGLKINPGTLGMNPKGPSKVLPPKTTDCYPKGGCFPKDGCFPKGGCFPTDKCHDTCKDKCYPKCYPNCYPKCHDYNCWPWINWTYSTGCYNGCYGGSYGGCYGGVIEVPVIVESPVVVQQPVVVQKTAAVDVVQAELPKIAVGSTITLRGEFGTQPGRVALKAGDLLLATQVVKWDATSATVTLPQVGLANAAEAKFVVLRADGSVANEVGFLLVPAATALSQN